jgi:hypothetical protein
MVLPGDSLHITNDSFGVAEAAAMWRKMFEASNGRLGPTVATLVLASGFRIGF